MTVNELVCVNHSQSGAGWPGHNQTLLQFVYACVWWFLFFFFGRAMEGSVVFADTSMLQKGSRKCPTTQFGVLLMLLFCSLLMGANSDPHFTCKDIALKGVLFLSL